MEIIRQKTGICPQHNILFDDLTCVEHLQLFAGIKGVPDDQIEKEVSIPNTFIMNFLWSNPTIILICRKLLLLCHVVALKSLPIHQYSVVIFTFPDPLGL